MAAHYRHSSGGRGLPGGRKRAPGSEEDEETVYITPLGAAKEVGRSCVILKHRVRVCIVLCMAMHAAGGRLLWSRVATNLESTRASTATNHSAHTEHNQSRTVMLDCGIHPGRTGDDALPFFDSGPDAAEIDLILISHFHLDHAASLPYFTEKVQARVVLCCVLSTVLVDLACLLCVVGG